MRLKCKNITSRRFMAFILSVVTLIVSLPTIPVTADISGNGAQLEHTQPDKPVKPVKPSKESDFYYDKRPNITHDQAYFENLEDRLSQNVKFGELPNYEEFCELTNYERVGITLTDYREKVGIGSAFSAVNYDKIYITTEDELNLLSDLVNGVSGVTASEQAFYSTATYALGSFIDMQGDKFKPIGTMEHQFNGTFDGETFEIRYLKMNDENTSVYIDTNYYGLFGVIGQQGVVRNVGVIGATIYLQYAVSADIGIIAGRNYGLIEDVYVNNKWSSSITVSNSTVGGIVAENYGTIQNTYADVYVDLSITDGAYSTPQPIATINHGTLINNYYIIAKNMKDNSLVNDVKGTYFYQVGWYGAVDTTGVKGVLDTDLGNLNGVMGTSFVKGDVITLDNNIYHNLCSIGMIGQSDGDGRKETNIWNFRERQRYSEQDFNVLYTTLNNAMYLNDRMIYYPTLSRPILNNGVYEVRTPANFMWITYYGYGEDYKLMNSIDMSYCRFTDTPRFGLYTLDGLRESADIADNIDIGATRCYAIMNLQLNNRALTEPLVSYTNERATISNVYFVGGSYTLNSSVLFNFFAKPTGIYYNLLEFYILGYTLTNVHCSIDISVVGYPTRNNKTAVVSLGNTCKYCSFSGSAKNNIAFMNMYCIGSSVEDSTSYAHIISTIEASIIYGVGLNCLRCSTYFTFTGAYSSDKVHGIGKICTDCYIDGVYTFDTVIPINMIGEQLNNCVFAGIVTSEVPQRYTYTNYIYYPERETKGFKVVGLVLGKDLTECYVSDTACLNGTILSLSSEHFTSSLYRGTMHIYSSNITYVLSAGRVNGVYDSVNDGYVDVTFKDDNLSDLSTPLYSYSKQVDSAGGGLVVGLGVACTKSIMQGQIKILGDDILSNFNVVWAGEPYYDTNDSKLMSEEYIEDMGVINLSDVDLGDGKIAIGTLAVIAQEKYIDRVLQTTLSPLTGIINFTINASPNSYFFETTHVNYVARNYGDVNLKNVAPSKISLMAGLPALINYGDLTVTTHRRMSFIYSCHFELQYGGNDNKTGYLDHFFQHGLILRNYGDITINLCLSDTDNTGRWDIGGTYGYCFVDGTPFNASVNTGDIKLNQIGEQFLDFKGGHGLQVYNLVQNNWGNITLNDLVLSQRGGYVKVYASAQNNYGDINLNHITTVNPFGTNNEVQITACSVFELYRATFNHKYINYGDFSCTGCSGLIALKYSPIDELRFNVNYMNIIQRHCSFDAYQPFAEFEDDFENYGDINVGQSSFSSCSLFSSPSVPFLNYNVVRSYRFIGISNVDIHNIDVVGQLNLNSGCILQPRGGIAIVEGSGSIAFVDVIAKAININGLGTIAYGVNNYYINNKDITLTNCTTKATSYNNKADIAVRGVGYCETPTYNGNVYNYGNITLSNVSFDKNSRLMVSGIGTMGYNYGDISLDIVNDIDNPNVIDGTAVRAGAVYVAGVVANEILKNGNNILSGCANFGNIVGSIKNGATVFVAGISAIYSVINSVNIGNIDIAVYGNTIFTNNYRYISGVSVATAKSCINYGNITMRGAENTKTAIYAFALGGTATNCINFGNLTDYQGTNKLCFAKTIGNYNVNYGIVDKLFYTGNASVRGVVDLGENVFDVDSVALGYTFNTVTDIDNMYRTYNDIEKLLNVPMNPIGMIKRHLTDYNDILEPDFVLRYDNVLPYEYSTINSKRYRNLNCLEYTPYANLRGFLKQYIDEHYPTATGAYVLVQTNGSTGDSLGYDLDEIYKQTWFGFDTDIAQNRQQFYNQEKVLLDQRDINTWVEVDELNVMSVEQYSLKNGDMQNVYNKSMTQHFQAPLKRSNGTYSDDLIVTMSDLYVVMNEFESITEPVEFTFSARTSRNSSVKVFTTPMIYDNVDDFYVAVNALNNSGVFPETEPISQASWAIPLADMGESTYCILGIATAQDGVHKNLMTFRLNTAENKPASYITSFSYPTSLVTKSIVNAYVNTDAFADISYSDTSRFDNTDKYTVERGVQQSKIYGEVEYPIYTLTTDMCHSSDGSYYDTTRGYIITSGDVSLSFYSANIKQYKLKIKGDDKTFLISEILQEDGTATLDGVQTARTKSLNLSANTNIKEEITDIPLSKNYTDSPQGNPFYRGGAKEIVVTGITDNGEELIMFKILFNKRQSYEDYLKVYMGSYFGRVDVTNTTAAHNYTGADLTVGEVYLTQGFPALEAHNISVLATEVNTFEYLDWYAPSGTDTNYPLKSRSVTSITAENGDTEDYVAECNYRKRSCVPISSATTYSMTGEFSCGAGKFSKSMDSYIYCCGETDTGVGLNITYNTTYASFYQSFKPPLSSSKQTNSAVIDHIYVYENGVLQNTLTQTDNNGRFYDSAHKCYVYMANDTSKTQSSILKLEMVGANLSELVEKAIIYVPVMRYDLLNDEVAYLQCAEFGFATAVSSEHRITYFYNNKELGVSLMGETLNDIAEYNIITSNNTTDYSPVSVDVNEFYIRSIVEPNATSEKLTIKVPQFATLEYQSGSSWFALTPTTYSAVTFERTFNISTNNLLNENGYNVMRFRSKAQDYDANDAEKSKHISYYTVNVIAIRRNKDVEIHFKDETETRQIYQEIIDKYGSLSITIQNMNGVYSRLQQTKIYNEVTSSPSYYKLALGDYAIQTNLPVGYYADVRIVGGSSEGMLLNHPDVRGKRLLLPYGNAQNIHIEVILHKQPVNEWGIEHYNSLFTKPITNHI